MSSEVVISSDIDWLAVEPGAGVVHTGPKENNYIHLR